MYQNLYAFLLTELCIRIFMPFF